MPYVELILQVISPSREVRLPWDEMIGISPTSFLFFGLLGVPIGEE